MKIRIHPHAKARMRERGATHTEVIQTVLSGTSRPARYGRTECRKTFIFGGKWLGRFYGRKRIEAFVANLSGGARLVVTVVVKYF
jgi:hypothetical protein